MKLIVQRVSKATVTINDQIISSIGNGYLVYVGINIQDKMEDIEKAGRKLLNLKSYGNEEKEWTTNIKTKEYSILCISQFTLFAKYKTNKPSFHKSMKGEDAKILYDEFIKYLKKNYAIDKIYDGKFSEYMKVESINVGPCTFIIDTKKEI